jgi:hypothetical protein
MPPLPPRDIEKLIPPKKDDQIFIDERELDPRIGRPVTIPGVSDFSKTPIIPGSGVPTIKEPSPIAPPQQRPIVRPPLRREEPIPLRPTEELIAEGFIAPPPQPIMVKPIERPKPKPISIGGVGGGTYKEFEGPDGRVLSVGVRPPSFSTNPDPRKDKGSLIGQIKGGIIGKNPVVSSGIGGIGARPSMPKPPQRPFFGKMIDRQPRQPMSVGGMGGISGRRSMRPMMRAGGGAISQAIADLQNRLR